MSTISFKGNPVKTVGSLPAVGSVVPDFSLTQADLSDISTDNFLGKKVILNIFPSIDTSICALSVRKFNAEVSSLDNTVVLCISRDLPFAQKRFCGAEGLDKVVTLSEMRDQNFGDDFGVRMVDGPLAGLFSRAVIVLDQNKKVIYTELVPEIAQEPDYKKVIDLLGNLK